MPDISKYGQVQRSFEHSKEP